MTADSNISPVHRSPAVSRERGPKNPLLTILIVVFRDRDDLIKILESIFPFRCDALEIVVIDGDSKDGTSDLLESLGDRIDYWISEPDRGIYDAMNKGVKASAGTYILHLNAGDRLLHIPWEDLSRFAAEKIDVVCCRVLLDGKKVFISDTGLKSKLDNTWHHQGTFYRREAHLGYAETYPIVADFDHNQRLLKSGCTVRKLPVVIADHDMTGLSSMDTSRKEIYQIIQTNFGWFYLMLSKLRFTLMAIRTRFKHL